ncbi:glycosyltransferase family 4 protein [Calidifontibacter indicus]|uniref:glycosyltransferase family 4 protein n=1 Tax=Calidifontibacter indicus TaxID=419650 RepID=UPI003D758E22
MQPERTRVLVQLNSLELGGTQLNAVDFARELSRHGFESVLVGDSRTLPVGPSLLDVARSHGIEIQLYEASDSMTTRARQLSRLAREHAVDLVHVYGTWDSGARSTYWGPARFGRRPWLQTVYEMEVHPTVMGHMPLVIGTEYLRDELATRPGGAVLVRPPVDTRMDRPCEVAGDRFREEHGLSGVLITIVSRLDPDMKALPVSVAMQAIEQFGDDATLVVVGTGRDAVRLNELGEGVNDRLGRGAVRFIGALSDPRPAYQAADIMLGMGGSAARSLACGKPLVVQGESGWSCRFEEPTAAALARNSYWSPTVVSEPVAMLVEQLRPLVDDVELRARLGEFGRRFAEETFGLTAMAGHLAQTYRDAAQYGLREWTADIGPELRSAVRKVVRHRGSGGE